MPFCSRSIVVCCTLACVLPVFSYGQSTDPLEPSDSGLSPGSAVSSPNAAQPKPLSDARIQEIRQQLSQTSDGEERYRLLSQLAGLYNAAGRVPESLSVREEIVSDRAISPGKRSIAASSLALSLALMREYKRSESTISKAKDLAHDTTAVELETLPREPAYAFLAAEAEIARRFENRHDVALLKYREHAELAWTNFNDPNLSEKRRRAAANEVLNQVENLTRLMVQNNRRAEALSYVNEMSFYLDSRPDLQPTTYQRAKVDHARAIALCSYDDYEGAMEAISRALKTYERGGTPEHDPGYGDALRMRLMIALSMERISEFGADAEALQRGRAIDPVLAGEFPGEESDSLALATRGQWAAAAARVDEIAQRNLRHQGAESPFYKYEFAMEMLERMSDPAGNIGFADIERYVSPLASTEDQWADVSTRGSYTEDGALVMAMDRLMRPNAFPDAAQAQALAFRIAELMRVNATQGALSDGAARLAAGDPKLRSLIEQEQGLRFEQNSSRRAFAALSDRLDRLNKQQQPDPLIVKRETNEVAEKEKALRAADGKITQLRRDIASQFPVYRELVAPSIPSPAKLGAVLRPGEVYVNLYAGRKATYAFVVLPGGKFQAQRLDVTRDQVRKMAAALRASFDAGTPPTKADDLGGFDLAASAGLFKALIGPLQASLQGSSTIYLSTSGILSSVPWNVLLTAPATTLADGKWWVASVTPVLIPTASALVLERSQTTKHGSAPFIAFADPSFDGQDHAPADASAGAHTVRERAFRSASAGGQPDLDYRNVAPLPETLEEVRAIGAVLKAPPQNIIRGTQATRTRVLKQDMSDDRVVAFATHGLLPGEVPGMLKAGLALAYEGKGLSDSVLTIDDIVALRLNADWVVLSACNTGFASGNAGDTISALARGFYAAGGRSLLVTQWSVESESAKELTVGLFTAYAADTNLTKASAIAQAQRDMLGGKYGALYRHPYFWGAYFLEGDAGR